jgi:uncharacterized protein (UPF0335 family)
VDEVDEVEVDDEIFLNQKKTTVLTEIHHHHFMIEAVETIVRLKKTMVLPR